MFKVKRIYDEREEADGKRYLVDRVWPRGVSKSDAALDAWLKELAPSTGLRVWFDHDPEKWDEFKKRYRKEIAISSNSDIMQRLRNEAEQGVITLLYAAKNTKYNNAVCLKEILEEE